jgi:hypothetical protein
VIDVFKPVFLTSHVYNEKINTNWIRFVKDSDVRPFKEKKETKNLANVLNHFRHLLYNHDGLKN